MIYFRPFLNRRSFYSKNTIHKPRLVLLPTKLDPPRDSYHPSYGALPQGNNCRAQARAHVSPRQRLPLHPGGPPRARRDDGAEPHGHYALGALRARLLRHAGAHGQVLRDERPGECSAASPFMSRNVASCHLSRSKRLILASVRETLHLAFFYWFCSIDRRQTCW